MTTRAEILQLRGEYVAYVAGMQPILDDIEFRYSGIPPALRGVWESMNQEQRRIFREWVHELATAGD